MAGWANARVLLEEEIRQSIEEGKSPSRVGEIRKRLTESVRDDEAQLLHAELLDLPIREDYPYVEPNELEDILRLRRLGPGATSPSPTHLDDSMNGAWLGRAVGCALGKPVEAFMLPHDQLLSWQRQKAYLRGISADEWPIRGYIPAHSPAEAVTGAVWSPESTREHIAFMETDDDIRYTVLGQMIVARYGLAFTSADVARTWLDRLPYNWVCTAETQAYRNLVGHYDAVRYQDPAFGQEDESAIDWNVVSTTMNPYREWIGAQIRVDSYGYAAPGRPEVAARLAYRDARISHTKNGIYGAMLCAAMISESFVAIDARQVVEAGLDQIPTTSRIYAAVKETIEICSRHGNDFERFEQIIVDLHDAFGSYHATHAINNACVVVAALLIGGNDFHRTVTFAVMAGWDTDCNGATVGSIVGAINGAKAIPPHWAAPLHDTLKSQVAGYHPIEITECARRSLSIIDSTDSSALWQQWW